MDAYDLILKDKERLLSFEEPVRFIFSHSALREGWDNPNVFVICTLKHSDNTISRRQEVGRGLRLVRQPARRSYGQPGHRPPGQRADRGGQRELQGFVAGFQKDISESLSARPQRRTRSTSPARCSRRRLATSRSRRRWPSDLQYLVKNDYTDDERRASPSLPRGQEGRHAWRRCRLN